MWKIGLYIIVLINFKAIHCDLELRVYRIIDDNYSLVSQEVEELVGTNLTLSCELYSPEYDNRITWRKSTNQFSFKNESDVQNLLNSLATQNLLQKSDINQSKLKFVPLKMTDQGLYFCGSPKFAVFRVISIIVRDGTWEQNIIDYQNKRINLTSEYCNEKMFKCKSNGVCITQHYVCDKKVDCRDGSDESWETCNGDPCRNKFLCEDRCIPTYWCCDKNNDLECNVTFPPPCCQVYSDPFEDQEPYGPFNMTQIRSSSNRYIFISLCILATFFSIILMVLILSKVFIFAKKTTAACTRTPNLFQLEDLNTNLRGRVLINSMRYTTANVIRSETALPVDIATGAADALLILSDDMIRYGEGCDRPPSYSDVMGGLEPPPPYTSQDCLNRS